MVLVQIPMCNEKEVTFFLSLSLSLAFFFFFWFVITFDKFWNLVRSVLN